MRRTSAFLPLALAALFVSPGASANCATTVLEALEKAWQQARLAQFDIDTPEQPLTGKPVLVRIDKAVWTNFDGSGYTRLDLSRNPMATDLRGFIDKGTARCETLVTVTYRGQNTTKYRVEGSLGGTLGGRTIVWIGKSNGLPAYHEFDKLSPGGFAWVYGDAVKEPAKK